MIFKYRNTDLGLLLVRLALAAVFFIESYTKFTNIPGTTKFFASIGLPYWVVWFIAIVEIIAAVTMLLGVLTEWGYVIAIEMAVIMVKLQLPKSWTHSNLELMIFGAALLVALAGPGKYSLLRWFRRAGA